MRGFLSLSSGHQRLIPNSETKVKDRIKIFKNYLPFSIMEKIMQVDISELKGIWVAPNHPVTCANPAPWQIKFIKIDSKGVVRVRCEDSIWFRLDQCIIDEKEILQEWLKGKGWR